MEKTKHPPLYYVAAGFILATMFFDLLFIVMPSM